MTARPALLQDGDETPPLQSGGPISAEVLNTPNYGYGWQTGAGRIDRTLFDEGLRQHMLRVYNYMGIGLGV